MKYLAIRNRVYPKNLNPNGTAFGGFIMAEMDKAASIMVENIMRGKAVTVFVDNFSLFKSEEVYQPLLVKI